TMTMGSRWLAGASVFATAIAVFACTSEREDSGLSLAPSKDQRVDAGEVVDDAHEYPPFELPSDGSLPKIRKVATEPIGRLTHTQRNPIEEVGIVGTDLGATFERDGKLVFVFGDTWIDNGDSFAVTTHASIPTPSDMPKLTWITDDSGRFLPP